MATIEDFETYVASRGFTLPDYHRAFAEAALTTDGILALAEFLTQGSESGRTVLLTLIEDFRTMDAGVDSTHG